MRVAWCSPLPKSGIECGSTARYVSSVLVPHLRSKLELELFDLDSPSASTRALSALSGRQYAHYLNAFKRHKVAPFDVWFYQLEDHPASALMRGALALSPGVVWVHDFVFSRPNLEPFQHSAWVEQKRIFNGENINYPTRDAPRDQKMPHAYRELGFALDAFYSSGRHYLVGKETLSGRAGQVLPIPVSRELMRIPAATQHAIGFSGGFGVEHRTHQVLSALAKLQGAPTLYWLIDRDQKQSAEKLAAEYGVNNIEFFWPRTPERWQQILPRISIATHTYFSDIGQPGLYLAMSLMAGRHCVVSDFGTSDYIPNSVVYKVAVGESEVRALRDVFSSLSSLSPGYLPIARSYAEDVHASESVAQEIIFYLEKNQNQLSELTKRWDEVSAQARSLVATESISFMNCGDHSGIDAQLLKANNDQLSSVFMEFGWGPIKV